MGDPGSENDWARAEILRRLDVDLFGGRRPATLRCGDWRILDYSSCLALGWISSSGRDGAYVKIPKADIDRSSVLPRNEVDRQMAEAEHGSLQYLARHWEGVDGDARFVEPLTYYPDLGAIVTRRASGHDLLHTIRRLDVRARLGFSSQAGRLHAILRRVGTAVLRFHEQCTHAGRLGDETPDLSGQVTKIVRAAGDLRRNGVCDRRLSALLAPLQAAVPSRQRVSLAMSLKGLDVRNILLDSRQDRLAFLDPGGMKVEPRQANLARLVVTIRILYWGTYWFFGRLVPASTIEEVVLDAAGGKSDDRVLRLYVVKELWKHWRAAYVALTRKRWPSLVERVLARAYIDRFYIAAIEAELSRLTR